MQIQQLRTQAASAEGAREDMARELQRAFEQMAALRVQVKQGSGLADEVQTLSSRLELAMEVIGERSATVRSQLCPELQGW